MPEEGPNSANLRLAIRVEGNWWKAYAAEMGTMEGAVLIGSIGLRAVYGPSERCARRKQAFMDLMRDILEEFMADAGAPITEWGDPVVAPEHERAGRT